MLQIIFKHKKGGGGEETKVHLQIFSIVLLEKKTGSIWLGIRFTYKVR